MYSFGQKRAEFSAEKDGKTEEGIIKEALWSYTNKCGLVVDKDGNATLSWDNGYAFEATKGGAKDYIPNFMKVHVDADNIHYGFWDDYAAMVAGGVADKLAFIMCAMRQVIFSMGIVKLSLGEMVVVNPVAKAGKVSDGVKEMLANQGEHVNNVIQQSYSILALNGISMVSRGHHYSVDDNFWNRLTVSGKMDVAFTSLKVSKWEDRLFHDLMHPFDIEWLTETVSDYSSELIKKVNGAVSTRWASLPAGCTSVALTIALGDLIKFRNAALYAILAPAIRMAVDLKKVILERPLDWNINFQKDVTAKNMEKTKKFEPFVAFMAGYLKDLGETKLSAMQAKSLNNIRDRNAQYYVLGTQATATFRVEAISADQIRGTLGETIDALLKELKA